MRKKWEVTQYKHIGRGNSISIVPFYTFLYFSHVFTFTHHSVTLQRNFLSRKASTDKILFDFGHVYRL